MRLSVFLLILATLLTVGAVVCCSPLSRAESVGGLQLHPTIESAGIVAQHPPEASQNLVAVVRYRPAGDNTWLAGPEMVFDRPALEWRVSLLYLTPDTEYEVEVRYLDHDGVVQVTQSSSMHTRPDYPHIGASGDILYVPDDGNLQAVIAEAVPGDTIRIRGGIYRTTATLEVENSGEPGAYLTIEAAPGAQVILDGSDSDLNDPDSDNWLHYQDSIYYTDLAWGDPECGSITLPGYVGEQRDGDGVRYLRYQGTDEWDDFLSSPPGSAYYDCQGRLYVVTYDADDPDNHEMHVSRQRYGIVLAGADYVRIRNLQFRYYGSYAIYFTNPGASYNVIEGNTFHGIGRYHIRVGNSIDSPNSDNLIQNNYFYERGFRDSGWTWRLQHDFAGTVGVRLLNSGPGNVIRRNTFWGGSDGIGVVVQSHETDVYDNVIRSCMDDGIEVDNEPGYNIRVWGNRISYCYTGISNQGWFSGNYWNSGPVYILRNVIRGGQDPVGRADLNEDGYHTAFAFKVGSDQDYFGRVYYYHNTIYIPDSPTNGSGVQDAGGAFFSGLVARNNIWSVTRLAIKLREPTTTVLHSLDCDNLYNSDTDTDAPLIEWSDSGGPEGDGVYRTLADFQAYTGQEMHGISDDSTRFRWDLSLGAGSPEIDAGCVIVGVNDQIPAEYEGDMPDMGAFEYQFGAAGEPSIYLPLVLRYGE
jgi:hypothetical protein